MKLLKRLLLAITLIVTATCTASAQKGMSGIGVNLGFGLHQDYIVYDFILLNNISLKYQYNFSNYYRIEPIISYRYVLYAITPYRISSFEIGINNHFFLTKVKRFRPYAIAGIGYMHMTEGHADRKEFDKSSCAYFCGGFGLDYRFSHKWSGQASLSYTGGLGDYFNGFIDLELGIAYKF